MNKYKNIIVCETHRKSNIPEEVIKRIKNSIKRSMVLATVPLVLFTSCSGEKECKENVDTTTLPGYTDNNFPDNIETDEIDSTSTITITKKDNGSNDSRQTNEDNTTSRTTTTRAHNNSVDNVQTVKVDSTATRVDNNKIYSELMEQLNKKLESKRFSDEANDYFRQILDKLYKNYPQWQTLYKDLPSTENYIKENLIDCIDGIKSVEIYSASSPRGRILIKRGYSSGQTDNEGNITMIFDDEEKNDNKLEKMLHEIAHINQVKKSDASFFKGNENFKEISIEGGATYHQRFINPVTAEHMGAWSFANDEGTSVLDYGKNNAIGYLFHLNIYENLEYLAGYETMNSMEKGDIGLSEVKEAIVAKYGDKGNSIWNEMANLYEKYNENWQSDETYNTAIKLQNLELKCVEQDIKNLNTNNPEQIKKYIGIYRNYKLNRMPTVRDSNQEDCTYDKFNLDRLDDLFAQKIIESKVIQFSSNEKLNKMAIKALLYTSHNYYYDSTEIYKSLHLPVEISNYKYVQQGEKSGYIIFIDNNGEKIVVPFDENSVKVDQIRGIDDREFER